jgi:hypothetical protein
LADGKTILPKQWFDGHLLKNDATELYEIQTHEAKEKYDLKDFTFIIPVSFDHPDRLANLKYVKRFLNTYFDTNIIVGEINTRLMGADVHFDFNRKFWRTKALNELTRMSITKYVVNYDCDVFFSPFQLCETAVMLRSGYDVVYPYSGEFAGIPRDFFDKVNSSTSLDFVYSKKWRLQGNHCTHSVGGAVAYDKEAFFKVGGENERFVSYNPEDQERFWRFNLLGLKVGRVNGCLYHLDHWRGENSGIRTKDSREGHAYWDSIKNFNKTQLLAHLGLLPKPIEKAKELFAIFGNKTIPMINELKKETGNHDFWDSVKNALAAISMLLIFAGCQPAKVIVAKHSYVNHKQESGKIWLLCEKCGKWERMQDITFINSYDPK